MQPEQIGGPERLREVCRDGVDEKHVHITLPYKTSSYGGLPGSRCIGHPSRTSPQQAGE